MNVASGRPLGPLGFAFWGNALLLHLALAACAWLLLPGGFPLLHWRFFAGRVLPTALLLHALWTAFVAQRQPLTLRSRLLAYPTGWLAVALGMPLVFPRSGFIAASVALALGLMLLFGLWLCRHPFCSRRRALSHALPAAALGVAWVWAQRAPLPSTRPLGAAVVEASAVAEPSAAASWLRVDGSRGEVRFDVGRVRIELNALLRFGSVSPDGFWTLFTPWASAEPQFLVHTSGPLFGPTLRQPSAGAFTVRSVFADQLSIAAQRVLDAPVYSHLNSFTRVAVSGHRRLALRFSPCPELMVEVRHAEYPSGAPARLAYFDARGVFVVAEATSAEKGPFTTLGEGPLARGEPLGVELWEVGEGPARQVAKLSLLDFTAQASVELSPTAGWGLPQNAVEFGLAEAEPSSDARLHFTLAGTSVGRGFDSVGHAAGVYSNRIEIQLFE